MQNYRNYVRNLVTLGFAAAFLAGVPWVGAALSVTRLTPPSALFSAKNPNPPIIARFLPGQRFDLQATISPNAGQTITTVQFLVDGIPVLGTVSTVPATVSGKPANTVVASLRAYDDTVPGVHILGVQATQSDSQIVATNGNFEIVAIGQSQFAAKNIILLIGDGMGVAHRTAARIMGNGVTLGKANAPLSMDTFPNLGLVTTHSLNSIVTDSSPGASCYATGNKANNNQHGVFPDDTTDNGDNPRVESIGEFLHRTQDRSLGIVTTTDLFDSTPGAFGSHTQARTASAGIIDQMFDERALTGLSVLMGGGRRWFLPSTTSGSARTTSLDYTNPPDVVAAWGVPAGALDPTRDLLSEYTAAGFTYAGTSTELNAVPAGTQKLLGLFTLGNMSVAMDKIAKRRNPGAPGVVDDYGFPDQPMLDEMAAKALPVLSQNTNGFFVMIEGGSIDKMAHLMDSERWIIDTIEFDRTIELCRQFATNHPDTLVIVTADHECAGANIIGASKVTNTDLTNRVANGGFGTNGVRNGVVGTLDAAGFPKYTTAVDGYPATTDIDFRMLIGYANNADRYEDWLTNPLPVSHSSHSFVVSTWPQDPTKRDTNGNFFVTGQNADLIATHTATDIALCAFGDGASLFGGVMDNTDVFFKMMQAAMGDVPLMTIRVGNREVPVVIQGSTNLTDWFNLPIQSNPGGPHVFFRAHP